MEAEKQHPHQSETALNENNRLRDLSSSAARPPASHPILKKPRGPSASGPRPTARFVSPQPSEDEGDKSSAPSSASTITPALEMRQHVPNVASPSKKKGHAKKIVASTAAAKRRPVLPRKKSSQSSVTSDSGSKDGPSSGSSRGSGTPLRAPSPIAEGGLQTTTVGSHEPAEPSAKALGKRPVMTRQTTMDKLKSASRTTEAPTDRRDQDVPSSPLHSPNPTSGRARHESVTSPSITGSSSPTSVPMAQSRSHSGFIRRDRPPLHSSSRSQVSASLSRGLFTGPTIASTTNIAATGTIIDQGGSVDSIPTPAFYRDHAAEMQRNHSSNSLFDLRFTPTQPTPGASVPLGRTKSQLTLVLERDEARAGKKPRSKS